MKHLIEAVLNVMAEVEGIEKTMTIGTGNSAYKGVEDKEVKKIVGSSMRKNGLAIFPTKVTPTIKIERWEEPDNYSKQLKTKQSVFTEVIVDYILFHKSGESISLQGYGHGIDTQDKGAGKAMTYALKYILLYTFLVPTGKIDDADNTHSNDLPTKPTEREIKIKECIAKLDEAKDLKSLEEIFLGFEVEYRKVKAIADKTTELKVKLTPKQ